ncbi:MAG: hypothetical protein AAFV27_07505 [Pseudomonadota bacterium]
MTESHLMPAPIAPIAWTALRIGTVAATAYYVGRKTRSAPKHVWRERAMDDTPEGLDLSAQREEAEVNAHAAGRVCRTIRIGSGPGLEVDFTALSRVRFRRVD